MACLVACALFAAAGGNPARAQVVAAPSKARQRAEKHRAIGVQRDYAAARRISTPFEAPEELQPHAEWGWYELILTKNRFHYNYTADVDPSDTLPDAFELLCYNRRRVGPTIRVRRGTRLRIRLHNALHGQVDLGEIPSDRPTRENAHGLCTTNLHTHGLHVSPSGRSDNIYKAIDPGCGCTFEFDIPANHPAGTFWYHPHKHGSVAYQLSNGLSGALIVEGTPGDSIHDLDDIPEIQAAKERILVLQWYTFGTFQDPDTKQKVGIIDAQSIYNSNDGNLELCEEVRPKAPITTPAAGDPTAPWNALAVNGRFNPGLEMAPGEIQRWRVIHAGWDVQQQFSWYKDDGTGRMVPADEVNVFEIALDGLPTGGLKDVGKGSWLLAPGQRSDVLIRAPQLRGGTPVTYYLKRLANDGSLGVDPASEVFVARLVVRGDPVDMKLPPDDRLLECRPEPVGDDELAPQATIPDPQTPGKFTDTLVFEALDPVVYTINGKTFHDQTPIDLTLRTAKDPKTAQEWKLTAPPIVAGTGQANVGHPFHIHVNPFQVRSREYPDPNHPGQTLKETRGEWRDTLFLNPGETWTIRSRFTDVAGLSVLHCHILDHEDQGMMVPINLIDPDRPPSAASTAGLGSLRTVSTPAPALSLADTRGAMRDLAEFRGRKVALVFFLGAECAHCTATLRALVRDVRASIGLDAEVVAVSSRRIADAGRAFKLLGVAESDRFSLLVDQGRRAFRDFGCDEGGPKHGLCLIDGGGVIRARYTGEVPFGDTAEVVRRLRALD